MGSVITFLGSCDKFRPFSDEVYSRGETLSVIYQLITESQAQTHQAKYIFDGPDMFGTNVNTILADAVVKSLTELSATNNIILMGHSRGAVIAILLCHLLKLIKLSAMQNDQLLQTVLKLECLQNITEVDKKSLCDFLAASRNDIINNLASLNLTLMLLDPVPGGGFGCFQFFKWHDEKFYLIPDIVTDVTIYYFKNERSRCFKPIVPLIENREKTKYLYLSLPGHHATGSGKFTDQNNSELPFDRLKVYYIQDVILIDMISKLLSLNVAINPQQLNFKGYDFQELHPCFELASFIKIKYHSNKLELWWLKYLLYLSNGA